MENKEVGIIRGIIPNNIDIKYLIQKLETFKPIHGGRLSIVPNDKGVAEVIEFVEVK